MKSKEILWLGIAGTGLIIAIIGCFLPVAFSTPGEQTPLNLGGYSADTTAEREITYCSETGLEVTVPGTIPPHTRILVEATFTYNVTIPGSGYPPTSSRLWFFIGNPGSSCQKNNGWFTEERMSGYSHEPTSATQTTTVRTSFVVGSEGAQDMTFRLWADKSDEGGDFQHHFLRGNIIAYVYEPLE
ncbi:MAG: hypothetical protein JSV43_01975 [Methanobacteriota archaeon]|nr:MAG: hypothetical protein JSV43_01975 [Euryarchaeota archaeon]